MEKKKINFKNILNIFKKKDIDVVKYDEVIDIFEHVIDKYKESVMLRAVISNDNKIIEIYSTNYKTTLIKAKKPQLEEIEIKENNEERKNDTERVKK